MGYPLLSADPNQQLNKKIPAVFVAPTLRNFPPQQPFFDMTARDASPQQNVVATAPADHPNFGQHNLHAPES